MLLNSPVLFAQIVSDTALPRTRLYDTVVISSLGRQPYKNIPYSISYVPLGGLQKTPRTQLMQQLMKVAEDLAERGIGVPFWND